MLIGANWEHFFPTFSSGQSASLRRKLFGRRGRKSGQQRARVEASRRESRKKGGNYNSNEQEKTDCSAGRRSHTQTGPSLRVAALPVELTGKWRLSSVECRLSAVYSLLSTAKRRQGQKEWQQKCHSHQRRRLAGATGRASACRIVHCALCTVSLRVNRPRSSNCAAA